MDRLKNIMLVDDDEIANHLHRLLIEDLAIAENIEVACDGEEALDLLNNKFFTQEITDQEILVLMDINMPGMDAFDFLEKFQEDFKDTLTKIHIALLSSSVNWRDQKKASNFEIDDYLDKPLTEEKLRRLMEKIKRKTTDKVIT